MVSVWPCHWALPPVCPSPFPSGLGPGPPGDGPPGWALPACWDYVHFMSREGTAVLGVSFMWVFLPFVMLLAALVVRSAMNIWRAWQGLDLDDAGVPVS